MAKIDDILEMVGMAEMRRRAEAYPDLLVACQSFMGIVQSLKRCPKCHEEECGCWDTHAAAIAQATEKGA